MARLFLVYGVEVDLEFLAKWAAYPFLALVTLPLHAIDIEVEVDVVGKALKIN